MWTLIMIMIYAEDDEFPSILDLMDLMKVTLLTGTSMTNLLANSNRNCFLNESVSHLKNRPLTNREKSIDQPQDRIFQKPHLIAMFHSSLLFKGKTHAFLT